MSVRPWPVVRSVPKGDFRIFKIREDTRTSPRTGANLDFVVLECANWVNVIALTPARELVMVEQFRHGSASVELEIPGGVMDKTDTSPVEAGVRELGEETGFAGDNPRIIGQVWSNPAIMNNITYTVLVENCRPTVATAFDHGEDLVTHLVPLDEVRKLAREGRIGHSLVVAALLHFELLERENPL